MKKDWTEVLKQKMDAYVPDDMQLPGFEDLKQKMIAAGAASGAGSGAGAGAGTGAPKGASVPMKRGLRWLAYAASLAAVVAGGALLLRDRSGQQTSGLADAGQQEVVAIDKSASDSEPVLNVNTSTTSVPENVSAPLSEPVSKPGSSVAKPTGVKPVSIVKKDAQPLLADAGDAAEPIQNIGLADLGSDPFAEPVEPVRKQLKRFSLGASGVLAANASARGDHANPNDLSVTTDREGNKYFDFGAPEIQYHYTAPVSGGLSLRYHFTNQFYAETGLRFTYLRTWVTPTGARQNLLFAGIPVGLGARFASLGKFDLYGSAYGMGSKCIYGSESPNYPCNFTTLDEIPLMWSVGVSPGAEYHITPLIGLYAEPTLSWYFKNEKAPNTLYKDNPLYFTLNIGVRFNM